MVMKSKLLVEFWLELRCICDYGQEFDSGDVIRKVI